MLGWGLDGAVTKPDPLTIGPSGWFPSSFLPSRRNGHYAPSSTVNAPVFLSSFRLSCELHRAMLGSDQQAFPMAVCLECEYLFHPSSYLCRDQSLAVPLYINTNMSSSSNYCQVI